MEHFVIMTVFTIPFVPFFYAYWHDDDVKMYNLESFDSLCELPCGLRRGSEGWG